MKNFSKILLWMISKFFSNLDTVKARGNLSKWLALLGKWIRTKGLRWTIQRIKLIRLVVTRYLSGSPLLVVDQLLGLENGWPKSIMFLKEYVDSGRPSELRFVITLLCVSRAMKFEVEADYSSITAESTATRSEIDPQFVKLFIEVFGLELFRTSWSETLLTFTMKGGPLGHQLLTSIHSLKFWDGPMWANAVHMLGMDGALAIKGLWIAYRDNIVWSSIEAKIDTLVKLGYSRGIKIRRLSLVNDPESKTRVIGIMDYFSQILLSGLSDQLFESLKRFPQDRTFTQDPHIRKVEGSKFYSFDLKSATDRFPLSLQMQLLGELLGGAYATAWASIMTRLPFATPKGEFLQYAVGQPMGAKSSWAMFTLSHHLVVQYAAFLAGKFPTENYILLGDDIVITDDKIAEFYVSLIAELGVEISPTKTHVSETTYEFAKRWFHNGIEVTGLPLNMIVQTLNAPLELFSALYQLMLRGYSASDLTGCVEVVICLYKSLGWPDRKIRHLRNLLSNFHFTIRNLSCPNYDEIRLFVAKATKDNDYVIPAQAAMLESELSRVGCAVANGSVILLVNKLSRYQVKLVATLTSLLGDMTAASESGIFLHPAYVAISNSVMKLEALGASLNVWGDLLPFLETGTVVDLDQLVKRRRTSVQILYRMSTFGCELYKQLVFDPTFETNINQTFRMRKAMMDLKKSLKARKR